MNKKILNQVLPNEDNYCWKNLTCTYRPWMVAFQSFGQAYEEAFLLLISFIEIYFDDTEEKNILNFVEKYNEYLEDFLGIKIGKYIFETKFGMQTAVVEAINHNQPVLVPCDLIALPYNPMYLLEHRYKCMVVKGYDLSRDLLYILDNIHIDYGSSTILSDFVSKTSEMYNMNKEIVRALKIEQCIYSLEKNKNLDISEYTIMKKLNTLLKKYLLEPERVVHYEKRLPVIMKQDNNKRTIEEIIKVLDFKYVFRDILHKLLIRLLGEKEQIEILCKKYDDVCFQWENIRNEILYSEMTIERMNYLQAEMKCVEEKEVCFVKELAIVIDNLPNHFVKDTVENNDFIVLNNNHAKIAKIKNGFRIEHDKKKKYDTWQMQDNACQLLVNSVMNGIFETKVSSHTCFGEDIHFGIIVKMKSGVKYLYGNVRGRFIAIYCPELDDKFELYSTVKYIGNNNEDDLFKVEVLSEKINFYYSEDMKPIFTVSTKNDEICSIGIFSKTWEYLDHTVLFYDIKSDIKNKI